MDPNRNSATLTIAVARSGTGNEIGDMAFREFQQPTDTQLNATLKKITISVLLPNAKPIAEPADNAVAHIIIIRGEIRRWRQTQMM